MTRRQIQDLVGIPVSMLEEVLSVDKQSLELSPFLGTDVVLDHVVQTRLFVLRLGKIKKQRARGAREAILSPLYD